MTEVIRVKYTRDIEKLQIISGGDWVDLRCAEDTTLKAGEFTYIPLGVAIQLPKGFEALVVPRSSVFKNYGIIQTNSIGVIDESYCGDNDEWHMPVYAVRDTEIKKNDRICQFRIIRHQVPLHIVEVHTLGNIDRGGLGSTGKNAILEPSNIDEKPLVFKAE